MGRRQRRPLGTLPRPARGFALKFFFSSLKEKLKCPVSDSKSWCDQIEAACGYNSTHGDSVNAGILETEPDFPHSTVGSHNLNSTTLSLSKIGACSSDSCCDAGAVPSLGRYSTRCSRRHRSGLGLKDS